MSHIHANSLHSGPVLKWNSNFFFGRDDNVAKLGRRFFKSKIGSTYYYLTVEAIQRIKSGLQYEGAVADHALSR